MKKLFEINVFWVLVVLSIASMIPASYLIQEPLVFNKTIGWGWDISNSLWWHLLFVHCSHLLFLIGYGVLYFLKRKTKFILSLLQVVLVVLNVAILFIDFRMTLIFLMVAWSVFILNMVKNEAI